MNLSKLMVVQPKVKYLLMPNGREILGHTKLKYRDVTLNHGDAILKNQ